jgi:sec-independent protein translocase protein TatC
MADADNNSTKGEGTLVSHLIELRDRLLRGVLSILVFFIILAPFANTLYEVLARPLMSALPEGNTMISTEPHGPFFVPFKFAFACAFALAVPYLLYQLWAFVAPGLYKNEKRLVMPLLLCGVSADFSVFRKYRSRRGRGNDGYKLLPRVRYKTVFCIRRRI